MNEFCSWLAATPLSNVFKTVTWIVPLAQSIHILGIAVVFSSTVLISVSLLGFNPKRPAQAVASTQLPWIWRGLVVLAITGAVLIISEPDRELLNAMFWAKMLLIVIAAAMAAILRISLQRNRDFPYFLQRRKALIRTCATVSLATWVAIIVAGRWIAYYFPGG